jgi:predicted nucleic acid-binding protein
MNDCVLDANVLVAWIDAADSLHQRAATLLEDLERQGTGVTVLDVLLGEAVSVLCRRSRERKHTVEISETLQALRQYVHRGSVMWVGSHIERLYESTLDLVGSTVGQLNFNDAFVVLLQREGAIGPLATFDRNFTGIEGVQLVATGEGAS